MMKFLPLAVALLLAPQDKVELRWKLAKGQVLVYKSVQKTVFDVLGQPFDQEVGFTYEMTVSDVADSGETTFQLKYLTVSTKGITPQGEFDYDSEKDKELPVEGPGAMMGRMVGQAVTVKLSATGRVAGVEGFEKVLEAMLKGAPGGNPQVRMQAREMFNNESLRGMLQQQFPPLPEARVGKDDSWSDEYVVKTPLIGGVTFSQKSKLADLKEGEARIEQELKVSQKEDKDHPLAGIAEIKESKGKATALFSTASHRLVSSKAAVEMLVVAQGAQMTVKSMVSIKLVEKN
ncbi:MAG: hypothetical protein HY293_10800 [Planctomycetes bacterium]|nr:hypothetical protein [Planctomycetota bacterium]